MRREDLIELPEHPIAVVAPRPPHLPIQTSSGLANRHDSIPAMTTNPAKEQAMSLEEAILKLVAALEANTAAIGLVPSGKPPTPPAEKGSTSSKPAKSAAPAYEAKHSHEEMAAALGEVKEKFGAPAAKAIIKEVGGKDKMAEITDPKAIDATYEAAKAKMEDEGM